MRIFYANWMKKIARQCDGLYGERKKAARFLKYCMSRLKAAPSLETLTKLFEKICFVLLAPTHDTITLKHLKELEKIVAEKEKIYNIDVENGKENKPWDEEEKVDEDGLQSSLFLNDNCLQPSPFLTQAQEYKMRLQKYRIHLMAQK